VDITPEGEFVVRCNAMSPLEMRPHFASYGGDAYFDRNWKPLRIVDDGLRENPDGTGNLMKGVTTYPGQPGWAEAKFRFRSSVSVLVTAIDHLLGVHLVIANSMVIASREHLETDHPIRRFLMPFTYNTIAVNDNAATNLCRDRTQASRCFGFTSKGLRQAYQAGAGMLQMGYDVPREEHGPFLDIEKYVAWKAKKGIDTEYFRQAAKYFRILKNFVSGILDYYYADGHDMIQDAQLMAFAVAYLDMITQLTAEEIMAGSSSWRHSEVYLDSKIEKGDAVGVHRVITNMLAHFCFIVTAYHEQVGAIEVYVQDASFCAFKWMHGTMVGTKQTATAQAALMMMTATPMPRIWGDKADWTYVWDDLPPGVPGRPDYRAVFKTFQSELEVMHQECEQHNNTCANNPRPWNFPMYVFDPALLETSISV
jgi:hypothetical protein